APSRAPAARPARPTNGRPPANERRVDPTPPAVAAAPVTPVPSTAPRRAPGLAPLSEMVPQFVRSQDAGLAGMRAPTPPAPYPSLGIGDGIVQRQQLASNRVRAIAAAAVPLVAAFVLVVTRPRAPSHVPIAAAPPAAEAPAKPAQSAPVAEQLPRTTPATPTSAGKPADKLELGRLPAPETILQQS